MGIIILIFKIPTALVAFMVLRSRGGGLPSNCFALFFVSKLKKKIKFNILRFSKKKKKKQLIKTKPTNNLINNPINNLLTHNLTTNLILKPLVTKSQPQELMKNPQFTLMMETTKEFDLQIIIKPTNHFNFFFFSRLFWVVFLFLHSK